MKSLDAESMDKLNQDSKDQDEEDYSNDEDLDETIYYSDHSTENTNIAPLKRSKRSIKEKSQSV